MQEGDNSCSCDVSCRLEGKSCSQVARGWDWLDALLCPSCSVSTVSNEDLVVEIDQVSCWKSRLGRGLHAGHISNPYRVRDLGPKAVISELQTECVSTERQDACRSSVGGCNHTSIALADVLS